MVEAVGGATGSPDANGPPEGGRVDLAVTFIYFRDLPRAQRFYEDMLGLELAIDQGWSKIYRIAGAAHLGLVDEARGSHRASDTKPVQICLRVPDVDAWHRWLASRDAPGLTAPRTSEELGIRVFVLNDPEGHQIEVQTPIRPGA